MSPPKTPPTRTHQQPILQQQHYFPSPSSTSPLLHLVHTASPHPSPTRRQHAALPPPAPHRKSPTLSTAFLSYHLHINCKFHVMWPHVHVAARTASSLVAERRRVQLTAHQPNPHHFLDLQALQAAHHSPPLSTPRSPHCFQPRLPPPPPPHAARSPVGPTHTTLHLPALHHLPAPQSRHQCPHGFQSRMLSAAACSCGSPAAHTSPGHPDRTSAAPGVGCHTSGCPDQSVILPPAPCGGCMGGGRGAQQGGTGSAGVTR